MSFPGFIEDAMNLPLTRVKPLTKVTPVATPTPEPPSTEHDEVIAKARIVFGSRLAGPGERQKAIDSASTIIAGIAVPPKPEEPDNCCMSGCVNCVWDQFRDEVEEWAAKSAEARANLNKQKRDMVAPDSVSRESSVSMDDDGGSSESLWSNANMHVEGAELFADIPVGIREFMKTEKKVKERKSRAQTQTPDLPG